MTRETKWARIAMPGRDERDGGVGILPEREIAEHGLPLAAAGGCPQPGGNRSRGQKGENRDARAARMISSPPTRTKEVQDRLLIRWS
ncbi:MAG: hypothetical protein WA624_17835 [Methylocella sp.]